MSKTPRTNEMLKRYDTLEDGAAGFMLLRQSIEELETELAEAQAEIERKDKLIEQMREALKRLKEEEKPNGYHDCIDDGLGECAWCEAEAALSAAERINK